MLDAKRLLTDTEGVVTALKRRSPALDISDVLEIANERRTAAARFGELRHEQKTVSAAFGQSKSMSDEERNDTRARLKGLSNTVKAVEAEMKALEDRLECALLQLPNIPGPEVPDGYTEADNVVVRTWGEPRELEDPLEHVAITERLGLADFEAGARVSGSRFVVYRGLGARMERALANFMLDLHVGEHGYEEILPPFLVNRASMTGTGQLPKFEEDAFSCGDDDLFLIPTAEVPVTNLHREQILEADQLPIRYAAYSACFRREAGSYGRDTAGLTRLHQFQKVELVQFTREEDAAEAHQALTGHAEKVLQALGLPYRVVELCAGDLGFSAQRCYDLEVWLAGQKMWREISSCSHFGEFQARRAGIRYRPAKGEKPRFVHTLNGSGLAIGRTVMALLEHGQRPDGSVDIPDALQPYMGVAHIPVP